ncbi:hypothetical protein ACFSW8_06110 [Rubritalea tangerina]|uniref:PA14 domain-containing protein n=1 Tax=Rubritalea tangerina TaxID=430798 RepID=A0ABW4Z9G4_9BACT
MTKITLISSLASSILSIHAAEIHWEARPYPVTGEHGAELATGIFQTDGSLVLAQNLGGPALIFDSIPFTKGTFDFGQSFDQYHAPSQTLSKTGTWSPKGGPSSLTLAGLKVGQKYRLQALLYDGRAAPGDHWQISPL